MDFKEQAIKIIGAEAKKSEKLYAFLENFEEKLTKRDIKELAKMNKKSREIVIATMKEHVRKKEKINI